MSVKHSSKINEHYTPCYIVEPAREVLGHIDLDPATSELANKRIQAARIFIEQDGLKTFEEPWHGRVFLNPPGGTKPIVPEFRSNPSLFWSKLMHEWGAGNVEAAIVIGFTVEVLQTTQGETEYPMLRFPFCIPKQRIKFDVPREERLRQLRERLSKQRLQSNAAKLQKAIERLKQNKEELVPGEQPPHANVIVAVPPKEEHNYGISRGSAWVAWGGPFTERFQKVFSELGYVRP